LADVVERWVPGANVRRDLWGFGDLIAIRQGLPGALIIQATSASNMAARISKARRQFALAVWLRAGNEFECWGWAQRNGRWHVRRVAIRADDLRPEELQRPRRRRRKPEQTTMFDLAELPAHETEKKSLSPGR
jgi:hypothetical protein